MTENVLWQGSVNPNCVTSQLTLHSSPPYLTLRQMEELDGPAESLDAPEVSSRKP